MSLYEEEVLKARKKFLKLNKSQEKELLKLYKDLANQLSNEIATCRTTSQDTYLRKLNEIVQVNISQLNAKLNNMIKANVEASSQIAGAIENVYYQYITDDATLLAMFKSMPINNARKIVSKLIQGNYYKDGKTLDHRLWNITQKNKNDINTFIKVNVLKGANARELAKQVDKYVNPTKLLKAHVLEDGMSEKIAYQAQRLARTSIAHSFSETTIENTKTNPFNKGIKWNLSASHFARMHGKTDICDDYAGRVFKPNEVPLQHPNCLCYFTEENEDIDKVIKELKAWTKGENNPKLDKWFEDYGKELVTNTSKTQVSKTFSKLAVLKEENSGIIKERSISTERKTNGLRKSSNNILTDEEINSIKEDIKAIKADESVFVFRNGYGTGYSDDRDIVYVSSNVLPDLNSNHPRDLMSSRAVLAHEYYGHRAYRGTKLEQGSWNDEFRASYMAAKNCPNLTDEDRYYLILDALERAKEKGITIKNNSFIRRILYGY